MPWSEARDLLTTDVIQIIMEIDRVRPKELSEDARGILAAAVADPALSPEAMATVSLLCERLAQWLHDLQREVDRSAEPPSPLLFWQLLCRIGVAEASTRFRKQEEATKALLRALDLAAWGGVLGPHE